MNAVNVMCHHSLIKPYRKKYFSYCVCMCVCVCVSVCVFIWARVCVDSLGVFPRFSLPSLLFCVLCGHDIILFQ